MGDENGDSDRGIHIRQDGISAAWNERYEQAIGGSKVGKPAIRRKTRGDT